MDATRGSLAVAVGQRREDAARVFGPAFDDLLVTTYDDLGTDLAGHRIGFLGIAAGNDMLGTLDEALARLREDRGLRIAVELPSEEELGRGLGNALLAAHVRVDSVERFGDQPCLRLSTEIDEPRGDDWWVTALTVAAGAGREARASRQDRVAVEWELAAARMRADDVEDQLRGSRAELAALTKQRKKPAAREGAPPPRSLRSTLRGLARDLSGVLGARGRRGRMLTLAGFAAVALACLVACPVVLGLLGGAAWAVSGGLSGLILVAVAGVGLVAIRTTGAVDEVRTSLHAGRREARP